MRWYQKRLLQISPILKTIRPFELTALSRLIRDINRAFVVGSVWARHYLVKKGWPVIGLWSYSQNFIYIIWLHGKRFKDPQDCWSALVGQNCMIQSGHKHAAMCEARTLGMGGYRRFLLLVWEEQRGWVCLNPRDQESTFIRLFHPKTGLLYAKVEHFLL